MNDAKYRVIDARHPSWTNNGPYTRKDAEGLARDLNGFVHRNSDLGSLFPTATVTGPFYARLIG